MKSVNFFDPGFLTPENARILSSTADRAVRRFQ